jgi:hypothetical protein
MTLKQLIGDISPSDSSRTNRARIHQGWWRAFVLKQKQGIHPHNKAANICNKLPEETAGHGNFISDEIGSLALLTAQKHNASKISAGIIEINRLTTNLLSSQPLCFNFFGLLALDNDLGLKTVKAFFPEITGFSGVKFEYAPKKGHTNDNSAFDVALEVSIGDSTGLIGIECKYTETFSPTEYSSTRYREIYDASENFNASASYEELTSSRFNQLFRNQLIAESLLLQPGPYQFVKTALFCSPDDKNAKTIGADFASKIKSGFKVIDFFEFITAIQKLDITETQRKATMMLWARYIAHELSEAAFSEFQI